MESKKAFQKLASGLKTRYMLAKANLRATIALLGLTLAMGTAGFASLSPIMGVIGAVLVVIIVVLVLAALAPIFFQAAADITGALLDADLNSTIANTIAAIVAILVPLVLLFGFVGLIFVAVRRFKGGSY